MRFTPTALLGSQQLGTFNFQTPAGATTGTFSSGGIDYGFIKFPSGSYTFNVTTGAEVDLLVVGGGGAGIVTPDIGSKGAGGGGVLYAPSTRLYKGTYSVVVGGGAIPNQVQASGSSISAYGVSYTTTGGYGTGESGLPTTFPPGANSPNCSGAGGNRGFGGGGSSAASGSDAFCNPSNLGIGGNGGQGLTFNMDGTPNVYGSGGGGGGGTAIGASAGVGGTNAGNGGGRTTSVTSGVNGFGGGGGGEYAGNSGGAGSGGHGTVIIRYRI